MAVAGPHLGKEAGGLNGPVIVEYGNSNACQRMRDDMDDSVVVLCVCCSEGNSKASDESNRRVTEPGGAVEAAVAS